MDEPTASDLVWGLLVGIDPSGAFWPEAMMLLLVLGPWPARLWLRVGGGRGSWGALRLAAGVYLYSRLAADFVLWGPVAAGAAACLALIVLAGRWRQRRTVEGLPTAAAGALLATLLALTMPASGVTRMLVCAVTVGSVFPSPQPGEAATPAVWAWHRAGLLWTGFVLGLGLDGLTLRVFAPLVSLGIAGWMAVAFELWRTRPPETGVLGRPALTAIAWVATALLGSILVSEGYFRFVYDASDANTELKTCKLWWKRHVHYNSWHYRDREFEPLNRFDGHLRVVVLGDSFGFGPGIKDPGDLIAAQLQAALAERPPDERPVAVFSLCYGGLTTADELGVFRRDGVRLRPQVVVLIYMLNDINDGTVFKAINHPRLDPYRRLMEASYALEFVIWRIYARWFMPGDSPYPRELEYSRDAAIFAAHRGNIEALMAAVGDSGAKLVVAVYPFLGIPTEAGIQRHALEQVLAVFAANEVPAVDVSTVVDLTDPQFAVNPFDPHPNEKVNRALAPVLAEMIRGTLTR